MPKSIYLDSSFSSNERLVTLEGYELIKELVARYQACKECHSQIDQADHLLVGKNICLSCILQKHPQMRFLGPVGVDGDGDLTYAFINDEEVIYTITANSGHDIRIDLLGSITKAGFKPPEYYVPFRGDKDNPIKLGRHNWTVYGSLKQSVVVLQYKDSYPTVNAVFLCYREGEAVELTKRNLAYKQMFERAKAVIERTKHKKWGDDYYYRPDGTEISHISDDDLYPIIAQFESAVWDVQRQFMPAYTQPELIDAEPQPLQVEEVKQEEEVVSETQDTETIAPEEPQLVEESHDPEITGPSTETEETIQSDSSEQASADQAGPEVTEPGEEVVSDTDVTSKSKRKRGKLTLVQSNQEETPISE